MNSRRITLELLVMTILSLGLALTPVLSAQQRESSSGTVTSAQDSNRVGFPTTTQSSSISAYITCDNEYALYYGNATGATQFVGARSCDLQIGGGSDDNTQFMDKTSGGAGCIATAQQYTSNLPPCDNYAYVAARSDKSVAQGLLASFKVGTSMIASGDSKWEVYPSNINLGTNGNPSSGAFIAALNAQIALAQWKPIAVDTTGKYPLTASPLPPGNHHWMWCESGKCPGPKSPFQPGCNHGEYLIFRLPLKDLLPPCLTAQVGNICCMGKDAQGHPIYAFSFLVNNPMLYQTSLTLISPSGTVINSYGPQLLPPGQSNVTSTFTSLLPPNTSNFCFVFQIVIKGGGKLTTELCFKRPCGPVKGS